jgi:hypothetical protein
MEGNCFSIWKYFVGTNCRDQWRRDCAAGLRPECHDIGVDRVRHASLQCMEERSNSRAIHHLGRSSHHCTDRAYCGALQAATRDDEPHVATMSFEHSIFNAPLTMKDANRFGCSNSELSIRSPAGERPLGTVVVLSQARRAAPLNPAPQAGRATVVILPVIRIEREGACSSASLAENSVPPSPRKRRKRVTRT